MSHTVKGLQKIFEKAARSALHSWGIETGHDDLVNDLWVWYLESPSVQKKLEESDRALALDLVRLKAVRLLKDKILGDDLADGRRSYSSDAIKEALKGESSNRYLQELLPIAMSNLDRQNSAQAEAIRSRYTDGYAPKDPAAKMMLSRAVKSLTEHVNVLAITAGIRRNEDGSFTAAEGPGSRGTVFPETRKQRGRHSDPTGNLAMALLDDEDVRYEAYRVGPINEFLAGAGGSVVLNLGNGARYRATGVEAAALKADPNLVRRTIRRKKKLLNE